MPRTIAARILILAVVGGVLFDITVPGNAPGLGALVLVAALLAAALMAAGTRGLRRMDPADWWLGPVAVLLAACVAIRSEPWLVAADLALAVATAMAAILALGGARITRGLVPAIAQASVTGIGAVALGAAEVLGAARVRRPGGMLAAGVPRQAAGQLAPVARGLVIAVPLAAIFVALFVSADAVFASLARTVAEWRPDLDVANLVERTMIVSGVAWGAAGLLALGAGFGPRLLEEAPAVDGPAAAPHDGRDAPPPPPAPDLGRLASTLWAGASDVGTPSRPRLGSVEAATVLVVLDALFALFVALQVAYLFGGRDTLAAAGITYADYARRGFFELVAATVVAGLVVVSIDLVVERRSRLLLALSIGLLTLTAVVLASALARLRLYQDAYGWTELRFLVLVAIAWLGAALGATGYLLMRRQARWLLHVLGAATIVAVVGMNAVGPGGYVAEQNLARAIDPSLVPPGGRGGLDVGYLLALGDAAVPPSVAALPRLSPSDRAAVETVLGVRALAVAHDSAVQGWPAWNLDRARARDAIDAWRAGSASR
jgi:hypothetical protein